METRVEAQAAAVAAANPRESEEAARSPPRQEERASKENPNACLPHGLVKSKASVTEARVLLVPLSLSKSEHTRQGLPQKRSLEQILSSEESPSRDHKIKRPRNRLSSPQSSVAMSEVSPSPAAAEADKDSDVPASVVAAGSSVLESDGELESDTKDEDEPAELSAYEKKRLKNIKENANFFASLKLFESAARLREMTVKEKSHGIKRVKPSKEEAEKTRRRSLRLRRIDPPGAPLQDAPSHTEPAAEEHPCLPPGPLQMIPADQERRSGPVEEFLDMWVKISKIQVELQKTENTISSLESYKTRLRKMTLQEDCVAKVVTSRIYSVAIHPSESSTLVAAGDKWGHVGLWNLDSRLEEGIHSFVTHTGPVSCMQFSPFNPAHLLSLSHDGTLRCGDVTRAVFDEVYRNEDYGLSSFDFLAADASTLVVGMWDGGVAIVDKRTPENSAKTSADLNSMIRTIQVHPVSKHYFITAGARNVNIYDVRHLKESRNIPVVSLAGHTKSVASAYFSPLTGNRAVTTCADDKLSEESLYGTVAGKAQKPKNPLEVTSSQNSYLSDFEELGCNLVQKKLGIYEGQGLRSVLVQSERAEVLWRQEEGIFGTKCLTTLAPVLKTIKHNNNTGRWLTRFRAEWDPKRDDCFVVGSMLRPRQIYAFHATGELVHSFFNENHLGSVCSINAWHPTRYILVGGNSSGRLHVFRE